MGAHNMVNLALPSIEANDVESFRNDGAVCIRRVLDSSWTDRMQKAASRAIVDAQSKDAPGGPRFRTLQYLWTSDPDFQALAINSPLIPMVAALLESQKVNLFADQLLVKEPGTVEKTPWHQDQPYWPLSGSQLCTVWVALDTVTLDSGAVEYIKGSHKWGKWFKPVSFTGENRYDSVEWADCPDFDARRSEYEFLHWDVEPGDCIIHHPLIVHGAGGNSSAERFRRAVAIRYAGDDVLYAPNPRFKESRLSGLAPGAQLDCELYPRVWPRTSRT